MKNQRRYPTIQNAEETIIRHCQDKKLELYGDAADEWVAGRLKQELKAICENGNAVAFLAAKNLTDRARAAGHLSGITGTLGSSLTAFLLGITGINPLCPHYRCEKCKHVELVPDAASGFDLPTKLCPKCGEMMTGDGHDIPFDSFGGQNGEKIPEISLIFTSEITAKGRELLQEIFPEDIIVRAGHLHKTKSNAEKFGLHPGGWFVIPVQYKDDVKIVTFDELPVTAQDYRELTDRYLKLDILSYDDLDNLYKLSSEMGVQLEKIPMNDPNALAPHRFSDLWIKEFPKSQAVCRAIIDVQLMWFKLNHPEEYTRVCAKSTAPNSCPLDV